MTTSKISGQNPSENSLPAQGVKPLDGSSVETVKDATQRAAVEAQKPQSGQQQGPKADPQDFRGTDIVPRSRLDSQAMSVKIHRLVQEDEQAKQHETSQGYEYTSAGPDIEFPENKDSVLIGDVLLGRYEILRRLGQGAFGVAYLAKDKNTPTPDGQHTQVAIKFRRADVLAAEKVHGGGTEKRGLLQEALIGRKLRHDNVVTTRDIIRIPSPEHPEDSSKEIVGIVMDYVPGGSLESEIRPPVGTERRGFSAIEKLEIALGVIKGLAYLHSKNIVHTDFKSANIWLQHDEVVVDNKGNHRQALVPVIGDLGTSVKVQSSGPHLLESDTVYGTPKYMPLYTLTDQKPSFQSDLYALGITLFELFTDGQDPFGPNSNVSVEARLEALKNGTIDYGPLEKLAITEKPKGKITGFIKKVSRLKRLFVKSLEVDSTQQIPRKLIEIIKATIGDPRVPTSITTREVLEGIKEAHDQVVYGLRKVKLRTHNNIYETVKPANEVEEGVANGSHRNTTGGGVERVWKKK